MTTPDKPAIPAELVERMVALLERKLDAPGSFSAGMDWGEAWAIVADLPKPVDPDLIEAQKIVAADNGNDIDSHECQTWAWYALVGIRRGRELERSAIPAHDHPPISTVSAMTDASMLTRVACAIFAEKSLDGLGYDVSCQMLSRARDVIEAMRDPTHAMVEAWSNTSPTPFPHGATDEEANRLCATLDWQAMIDAALAEE